MTSKNNFSCCLPIFRTQKNSYKVAPDQSNQLATKAFVKLAYDGEEMKKYYSKSKNQYIAQAGNNNEGLNFSSDIMSKQEYTLSPNKIRIPCRESTYNSTTTGLGLTQTNALS